MKQHRLRKLLGAATAAALAVSAVCLGAACIGIYRTGEFTPQAVTAAFQPIAPVIYLSLALCAAGLAMHIFLPEQPPRPKAFRGTAQILKKYRRSADLDSCEPSLREGVEAQRLLQRRLLGIRATVLAVLGIAFLSYALNPGHFHDSQINASMIRAMALALPCLLLGLALSLYLDRRRERSMEAELALLKQAPKAASAAAQPVPTASRPWLRWALLTLSAAALVYGCLTGGTLDVLTKAVNICTECVGLG